MRKLDVNIKNKIITFSIMVAISIVLFYIGCCLNSIVINNNCGRMPVDDTEVRNNNTHFPYSNKSEINNWYLSDIFYYDSGVFQIMFNLYPPILLGDYYIIGGIFSLGDYFILMGFYSGLLTYVFCITFIIKTIINRENENNI